MGLAERFNPEDEALVVAAGNSIYSFGYGKMQCIATRPRKVSGLALHSGRVVDCGNYKGVRDTLEGRVAAGTFYEWAKIAEHNGTLFGAVSQKHPETEGIWDICRMERVGRRNGRTRMLASAGGRLLDSGEYKKEGAGCPGNPEDCEENSILDSFTGEAAVGLTSAYDRVVDAITYKDGKIIFATPILLAETEIEKPNNLLFYLHQSAISKDMHIFMKINATFAQGNYELAWPLFCFWFDKLKEKYPREFRYAYDYGDSGKKTGRVEINPIGDIGKACKYYYGKFKGFQQRHWIGYADPLCLKPILERACTYLMEKQMDTEGIQAIAKANGAVLIGSKAKKVEVADQALQEIGENVLHEFRQHVNAMLAVPIEVYNDGIRQRMLQRQGQRAAHAKSAKSGMVRAA